MRGFRMRCPRCGYEWEPKIHRPKECPRCKQRLDSELRRARGTKPRAVPGEGDQLLRELQKGVRDAQRDIDNFKARITEIEGRVDRMEKKLKKMGDIFG